MASTTVQTDAQGNAAVMFSARASTVTISPGNFIAATATDPRGSTSELSFPCIEVGEE